MSSPIRQEAASRHHPIAHQRDASKRKRGSDGRRHESETRLQAAVARPHPSDERDPYADVPCTD